MKNNKIEKLDINEARSITKISKELASVTSRMKELADEFYGGELGSSKRVEEIKNELRELTPKKKALIDELDNSVAGKDRNIELAIEESLLTDEELLENHLNEKITVKQALRNASDALLETPQGKKFDTEYIYDYLQSLERMAKKDPKSFVKDYGDFTINDYIEDVEYNMANESVVNEGEYVIIDTRGNARDIGSKIQGQRFLKGKKGFHIVLKKNALKARRAIEKNGGKTTGSKISDILYDMMYEATKVVEAGTGVVVARALIKKGFSSSDSEEKLINAMVDYLKDRGESRTYISTFTSQDGDDIMDTISALQYFDTKEGKKYLKENPKGPYESKITEAKQRKISSSDMEKIEKVVDDAELSFMRLPSSETWMEDYNTDDMVGIILAYYNRPEYKNSTIQDILDLFDVKKQKNNIYGWQDEMQAESNTSAVTEKRNIQTKRKYTDSHPAKTVGSSARIRNKILEAIKDGKMHQDEFNRIVKELSSDHKRWMKRNSKMFNVSEEGISLTRFGQTILKGLSLNESLSFESFKNNK
jgi:hypothetical protein